ncbi:MAG: hypothetical protein Q8L98_02585 [Chlamydiales bacterium]|nr:hypothetical protein [Chlamydiales bacterium]
MAAALQNVNTNTWTIREEYATRKMTQPRWEITLSSNQEIIADKISDFVLNDALKQLKDQFQPNRPLPNSHYHLVLPPYSLSLRENITNKPWLLEARDIPPFNEIIPLVSEETSYTLEWQPFLEESIIQAKQQLQKDNDTEQGCLDRLMVKVNEAVLNQLQLKLKTFTQHSGNESLQYEVSLDSKYVGHPKVDIHISFWIDKTKL